MKGTKNEKIWYRVFQEEGAASAKALRLKQKQTKTKTIFRNGKEAGIAETLCMEGQRWDCGSVSQAEAPLFSCL